MGRLLIGSYRRMSKEINPENIEIATHLDINSG